jgi:hypothetical protein
MDERTERRKAELKAPDRVEVQRGAGSGPGNGGHAGETAGGGAAGSAGSSGGYGGTGLGGSTTVVDDAGLGGAGGDADAGPEAPCAQYNEVPSVLELGDQSIDLSALSARAVLWLDPTTLPEPGQTLDHWCDRSGRGNHAVQDSMSPPHGQEGNRPAATRGLVHTEVVDAARI